MATKQKKVAKKESTEDIALLREIFELGKDIKEVSKSLNNMKERKDDLIQEAVNRKIERAGDYKLIAKERCTNNIDMAAIEQQLTQAQFLEIAHVSIKDAEKYLTKEDIEHCTTRVYSVYYQVQEMYKPKELK